MATITLISLPSKRLLSIAGSLVKNNLRLVKKTYSNVNVCTKEVNEDSNHIDLGVCAEWNNQNDEISSIKNELIKTMTIIPNFISEDEETNLLSEIEPSLKRLRYEFDHWDNAIHGFRETERSKWSDLGTSIAERIRDAAFNNPLMTLPHIHILDLDSKGYIKPHVDAVKFCGNTIAGVCLLSPAVMRLRHSLKAELFADFLLTRRCLYTMTGSARYDFSHEVLKNEESYFRQQPIVRSRRISFIVRNEPNQTSQKI